MRNAPLEVTVSTRKWPLDLAFLNDALRSLLQLLEQLRLDAPRTSDAARRLINGFLNWMSGVTARPQPCDLMCVGGALKLPPPIAVSPFAKAPRHRLDDVTRIRDDRHAARLAQSFEAEGRRGDLGLLIGGISQVARDRTPRGAIVQKRDRGGARLAVSIAQTRSVAVNRHRFQTLSFLP